MESKNYLFLLVLVFANCANSNPINETQPTVPSISDIHDKNAVFGDIPVDQNGVAINCNSDRDCQDSVLGEFSVCRGTSCHCILNSHQSSTSKKCLIRRNLGEGCEEDQQCDDLGEAECSSNICKCKAGAEVIDKKCWTKKNMGDACKVDEECKVTTKDAHCKDSVCTCRDGMITHSDSQHCLKVAEKVGDACEETPQCAKGLGGATCHQGTCKCQEAYHERNHGCVKTLYLGDNCRGTDGECFLPNSYGVTRVVCKDTCQCIEGLIESEDKKHCLQEGEKDPGTGGAASVYPLVASILTVVTALILTF